MSAAAKVLLNARLAGITVAPNGDSLRLEAASKPPDETLDALRRHKPAILQILTAERCEACHAPGTPEHPLLEAAYCGHWLLLHRHCLTKFLESEVANAARYALQRVCDQCGQPGGHLENIGYRGGPIGGVPVHLRCAEAWFARLLAIPARAV